MPLPTLLLLPTFLSPTQATTRLLEQHDPIVGVGRVESIQRARVLDDGTWLAQVTTDFPTSTQDGVTVRIGLPILREGDPLPSPSGARVRRFHGWDVDGDGNLLWEIELAGSGITNGNRQALYWNARLLGRQDRAASLPGFGPGASWRAFGARLLGPDGRIWITASVDPGDGGLPRSILASASIGEDLLPGPWTVLAAAGDSLEGIGTIRSVTLQATSHAANRRGDLLWSGKREGSAERDGFLALGLDRCVVAEGDPAPVAGRTIASLEGCEVSLNDLGRFAYTANLNADPLRPAEVDSNYLLVVDDAKWAQEGDRLPSLGAPLGNQPETPVFLSNAGDLYWGARMRETPSGEDEAYMRNHDVLIREQRTLVGGELVVGLDDGPDAFSVSPSGRFFVARVTLEGGRPLLLLMDHGAILALPGCGGVNAFLEVLDGKAVVGDRLRLAMDAGQVPGAQAVFCVSAVERLDEEGCGAATSVGELFLAPPLQGIQPGPVWVFGRTPFDVPVPPEIGLVDSVWFGQGFFVAPPTSPPGTPRWKPAGGVRIELGAP